MSPYMLMGPFSVKIKKHSSFQASNHNLKHPSVGKECASESRWYACRVQAPGGNICKSDWLITPPFHLTLTGDPVWEIHQYVWHQ